MVDLKLGVPATDEIDVNEETLASIDRGVRDAEQGRTVTMDDLRNLIPKWISKFGF